MNRKIRVLVVDDSPVLRNILTKILTTDPDIDVIGTAADAYEARDKVIALQPDVITLDVEMPKVDGISFLKGMMEHYPIPTLIVSAIADSGSQVYLQAMEAGAVDIIKKPTGNLLQVLPELSKELLEKIKMAYGAHCKFNQKILAPQNSTHININHEKVVAIASSTGGTEALKVLIQQLPKEFPPLLIVQHMPAAFIPAYINSLQRLTSLKVKIAEAGELITENHIYMAPGDYHLEVGKLGSRYQCKLNAQPALHGVRPAADYLFYSLAKCFGKNCVAAILTGMGKDGAAGIHAIHKAGGSTFAQNEETCVVFGMPKAAIELGAIQKTLPLDQISKAMIDSVQQKRVAKAS